MDIFVLNSDITQGQLITGYESAVWTERYLEHGDFKIETPYDPVLREQLPIGSLISHFDTREIMRVRDHHIVKKRKKQPTLSITGDSFETYLQGRIAAPNSDGHRDRFTEEPNQYLLAEQNAWIHAYLLIYDHFTGVHGGLLAEGDTVPFVNCVVEVSAPDDKVARVIERGSLYERVIELLSESGCGIKTRRPIGESSSISIVIYKGADRSRKVILSATLDEVEEAEYLFTDRKDGNAAFAIGKYDGLTTFSGDTPPLVPRELERKWVYIDSSDIEDDTDPTIYDQNLSARLKKALRDSGSKEITQFKASSTSRFQYNKDYFLGDIVGVNGDFGVNQRMVVEEFTRVEDKNGDNGYPTLVPTNIPVQSS